MVERCAGTDWQSVALEKIENPRYEIPVVVGAGTKVIQNPVQVAGDGNR